MLLERDTARLGQALDRDLGFQSLDHLIRDARHRFSCKTCQGAD
jgi:hypothetical protein